MPDAVVAACAARQHGVVTFEQLLAAGLTPRVVEARTRAGLLRRLHFGVYAVGPAWSRLTWWHAAVLACGETALLSHRSLGALLEVCDEAEGARVDVTVLRGRAHPQPGIRLCRPRRVDLADRGTVDGIPATSPARLALDLATRLGRKDVDRAVNELRARGLATVDDLRLGIARYPRHAGARTVARLLAGPMTRSELERAFRRLLVEERLAGAQLNARVLGEEVDAWWPELRLVIELDGAANHFTPGRVARDVRKQAKLEAAGVRVQRLSWWDVQRDRARTADRLRRLGVPAV